MPAVEASRVTNPMMPHQAEGAKWLAMRKHGYLGDKPGLGKTRTVLAALRMLDAPNPLVVCPAIVRTHWLREAAVMGVDIWVRSYDEMTRGGAANIARLTLRDKVGALVLDEAHYLKNTDAQRTKILLGRDGLARRIPIVYAASGTPIPRHPGELWPIVSALWPELALDLGLRTQGDWIDHFCITGVVNIGRGQFKQKVYGVRNTDELHVLLGKIMLRRDPKLERIWWQTITLDSAEIEVPDLDAEATSLIRRATQADKCRPTRRERLFTTTTDSLADIANDPAISRMRRRLGELKAPAVVQMLRDQLGDTGDEQVVVMFQHRAVGNILRAGLEDFGVGYVDGATTPRARETAVQLFREGSFRVFVGQQQACGTGLDGLQVARRVILVEPSWVAAENAQAGSRIDRMGQKANSVIGQMIALSGTLDEAIVKQNLRETMNVAKSLGAADGVV